MDNHQIVETLENIIKDITKAKNALKANNVTLKSNATISLADEINSVPDSIKASNSLEGFNGGQNTLKGGFIYPNSESVNELNDSNTTVVKADEYEVPKDKYLNLTFPTPGIVNNTSSSDIIKFRYNGKMSNIYYTMLNALYRTYLKRSLTYDYNDSTITQVDIRKINVLLRKGNLTVENGVYKFGELVFPTFNTNFYAAKNDDDKEGTLITNFEIDRFHFSLNYRGKDINIKCNKLIVDLDFATQIIKKEISGHDGYHYITDAGAEVLEYYNHRDDTDNHIIYLPEFNVEYAGIDYAYNGLSLDANIERAYNVQIRTEENDINKTLLDDPKHIANILRLVKVYNMDGTKIYNPITKAFEDASTSGYVTSPGYTIDDNMIDATEYYKNTNNVMMLDENGRKALNYKEYMAKLEKNTKAIVQGLNVNKGYVYYMIGNSIEPELIRYDESTYVSYYQNFPMAKLLEGALRLGKYSNSRDAINAYNSTSFDFADEYSKQRADVYPFITNCAFYSSDTIGYGGIRLYVNVDVVRENGVKYTVLKNAVNTLVSHYDVKLYNNNDLDLSDANNGLVENIKTNAAPLVYNENIKSIKIVSDGKKHGVLKSLLGYGMIYPVFDGSRVPEKPATPMKYILDKDSTIEVSKSVTYKSKYQYSTVILGPYTTDEMAKYVDKFVHVLVPEDHPGLGKYNFCKFRLPLYNLDETKKYNYSKKAWEPVNALTDDSTSMEDLYPDNIAENSYPLEVFQNNQGFSTVPSGNNPMEEYDHL
jgi:hypothetical protein|nr:MAG TPA: hypothetical protein [Caudoviricetes sp.]